MSEKAKSTPPKPSDREWEVLRPIWEHGPLAARDGYRHVSENKALASGIAPPGLLHQFTQPEGAEQEIAETADCAISAHHNSFQSQLGVPLPPVIWEFTTKSE